VPGRHQRRKLALSVSASLRHCGLRGTANVVRLTERFGSSGWGDQHGHASQPEREPIDELVAYLETL
jgi:hypothetical protein